MDSGYPSSSSVDLTDFYWLERKVEIHTRFFLSRVSDARYRN